MSNEEEKRKAIASELREYALGNLDLKHHDVHRIVGLIPDKEVRELLMFMAEVYEPLEGMPDSFWETNYATEIVQAQATNMATNALHNGSLDEMEFLSGLVGYDLDMSTYRAIDELESLWRDYPTFQTYVYGPPPPGGPTGSGKTDFSYTLIEIGKRVYPDMHVASNNSSDDFQTIQKWSSLESWLKNTEGRKVFLFDEASQLLQYADMGDGQIVSKLLKLLRKYQGNLILIGHTGRDVSRDVRRQMLITRKKSKEGATIGVGLEEHGEEIHVNEPILQLAKIPPTRLSFESVDDEGEFVFDTDGSDGDEMVETGGRESVDTYKVKAVVDYLQSEEGLRPVADRHDVSHESLREWVGDFDDDD